jgi:hypothetical protein
MFIPQATGVPGMWGEAPQWWDNSASKPRSYNDSWDDPRWNGATRRDYQTGTSADAAFRAVYMNEGGKNVLYLQWHVYDDPSFDALTDSVFVGFQQPAIGTTQYIFEIGAYTAPPAGGAAVVDAVPGKITAYQRAGTSGVATALANQTWMTESTRIWLVVHPNGAAPDTYEWVISMRVPVLTSGTINAAGAAGGGGINLSGASFKFFFAIAADQGQQIGVSPSYWPREENQPGILIDVDASLQNVYPNPGIWDDVHLGIGGGAVSLDPLNLGTANTDPATGLPAPNQIRVSLSAPTPVNHVYAKPYNGTAAAIPAHKIFATFRTANWGSQIPWSWQTAAGATAWEEITDGNPPPNARNNAAPITSGAYGEIAFDWQISTTQAADWVGPSASKMTHQCMLVTLSAPGTNIDFANDSVYRNMDFVKTSVFNRTVELSLEGLPKPRLALPTAQKDVFVIVNARNMPKSVPAGKALPALKLQEAFSAGQVVAQPHLESLLEHRTELLGREAISIRGPALERLRRRDDVEVEIPPKQVQLPPDAPTIDDMLDHVSSVQYSTFYATGKRIRVGNKVRPVLKRMTSFGYIIQQSRAVTGWDYALGGVFQKVGPNVYKVRVTPGATKAIYTKVQGYEQVVPAKRMPEIIAGPPGKIQASIPIAKNLPAVGSLASRVTSILRLR